MNRICRYCKCDISHLHHNSRICTSEVCHKKQTVEIKKRAREVSDDYRKRVKEKRKMVFGRKSGVRICTNCKAVINGPNWKLCRMCHEALKITESRIDGDYLFA